MFLECSLENGYTQKKLEARFCKAATGEGLGLGKLSLGAMGHLPDPVSLKKTAFSLCTSPPLFLVLYLFFELSALSLVANFSRTLHNAPSHSISQCPTCRLYILGSLLCFRRLEKDRYLLKRPSSLAHRQRSRQILLNYKRAIYSSILLCKMITLS